MSRKIGVQITATAHELGLPDTGNKIHIALTLQPEADSHGEACVLALRHAADVAAARLGILDRRAVTS